MARLLFETSVHDGRAIVALRGELDLDGAGVLEPELARLEAQPETDEVVIDLRALEFMDSSGLRLVALAHARAEADGRKFGLVPGTGPVQKVFEITGMDKRLAFVTPPETR